MEHVLSTENLSYIYSDGTPFRMDAISDISISINRGETVGIIGHTGSGKSTLIQHLNGLLKPASGKVYFCGADIWEKPKEIRNIRFKVGMVFQYPEHQLFADTVYKDIAFGPENMSLSEHEIDKCVRETAALVGINDDMLSKSPFDLSGGEKRRAAIAGVLAMRPEVLILDEPTAGLDPSGKSLILDRIMEYKRTYGATVIMVSHSMDDIAAVSDRVLVMNKGRVFAFDTVENIFSAPEKLAEIGLSPPGVTEIFSLLNERYGAGITSKVFTVKAAVPALVSLFKMEGDK